MGRRVEFLLCQYGGGAEVDSFFMTAETALLCDIIRAVPNGSMWHITPDSWERIPAVLGPLLEVVTRPETNYEYWMVMLSEEMKEAVIYKIVGHELAEKIVHMDIESPAGTVLFRSWDRMCSIDVANMPDGGVALMGKYPNLREGYV